MHLKAERFTEVSPFGVLLRVWCNISSDFTKTTQCWVIYHTWTSHTEFIQRQRKSSVIKMWNGQRSLGHNRTLYIKDRVDSLREWRSALVECTCRALHIWRKGHDSGVLSLPVCERVSCLCKYLLAGVENTPRTMSLPCILMMGLVEWSRLK